MAVVGRKHCLSNPDWKKPVEGSSCPCLKLDNRLRIGERGPSHSQKCMSSHGMKTPTERPHTGFGNA